MRLLAALSTALLFATAFSACIEIQSDDDTPRTVRRSGAPPTYASPAVGNMTGEQKSDDTTTAPCQSGVQVPPSSTVCAKRTIVIGGAIDGLKDLPVTLSTFAGGIDVTGGADDAWTLTTVLGARGADEASAVSNLENIEHTWSHVEGAGHHLKASAKKKNEGTNNQETALLQLTIPRTLELFLTAVTSSGGVDASDLKVSQANLQTSSGGVGASKIDAVWLYLSSSSGGIDASDIVAQELEATTSSGGVFVSGTIDTVRATTSSGGIDADLVSADVQLHASSGGVSAKLTPSATGSFSLMTTSGGIDLEMPEAAQYGYSVDAEAVSGSVTIDLEDGTTTGKEGSKHFITNNYKGRSIRTEVDAKVTSGSVGVGPA